MHTARGHGGVADIRRAIIGGLLLLLAAAHGLCQTGGARVGPVVTGPLTYTFNPQGFAVQDEGALPGAQIGLAPAAPEAEPDASAVAYEVTLLDLGRPRGALDAVTEGAPIVLTPARLADLRRRHAPALADTFSEDAWSELVADLLGLRAVPPSASGKPGSPAGGRRWELPQQRLLWTVLRTASEPRLFLDFDAANRPRVWGSLTGKPAVPGLGSVTAESASQRDLLAASAGVQGLVLIKSPEGDLVPPGHAVEVVITGAPGGQRKTWIAATNTTGYFCWPLPADAGGPGRFSVGIPDTDAVSEVILTEGAWSNVVMLADGPLPEGSSGEKGVGRGGEGARDAVGIVGALTGLLAGTAAGSIVPMLSSSGLPLQTGVVWTPKTSARAYYGVERALQPSSYDRSLKALGQANLVIEFCRYPLVGRAGQARAGEVERAYCDRAKALCDAARERSDAARAAVEASGVELERLARIIREAHPETDAAAYKALVESQIALRKDDRERRAEADARAAAYQAQLDLYDLCRAHALQAMGPTAPDALELWTALCPGYNRYGQLPARPTNDDLDVLYARIEQKLSDDAARAEALGPDARFQDPREEHLAYEGTPQRQDKLGYVRFVRVRLIATGIPTEALNVATRLKPGRYGLSAGMVAGEGGSQPAVGGWWLWDRLGLRLTAGSTFASNDLPGELMLGCGVQVPLGTSTSSGGGASGSSTRSSAAGSGGSGGSSKGAGGESSKGSGGASSRPDGGASSGGRGRGAN